MNYIIEGLGVGGGGGGGGIYTSATAYIIAHAHDV